MDRKTRSGKAPSVPLTKEIVKARKKVPTKAPAKARMTAVGGYVPPLASVDTSGAIVVRKVRKCPESKYNTQWIRFATRVELAICAQLIDIPSTGLCEEELIGLVLASPSVSTLDHKSVRHLSEVLDGRARNDWSDEAYMNKFDARVVKTSILELENAGKN